MTAGSEANAVFERLQILSKRGRAWFPAPFRFILLCALIAAAWSVLYAFPATKRGDSGFSYPPCPFHALTGLHCAGCGSLRAMSRLARGDVPGAWAKNKLAVCCVPFLIWGFLAYGAECFNLPFPKIFIQPFWIWLLLVMIILFWILRNVPSHPFSLLAPL